VLSPSSVYKNDLELLIEGNPFLVEGRPYQEVDILVNGGFVAGLRYDMVNNDRMRVVRIPRLLVLKKGGPLRVEFLFRNPVSPAELGLSGDERRLGLRLVSIELDKVLSH
jgi:hypothetical protein